MEALRGRVMGNVGGIGGAGGRVRKRAKGRGREQKRVKSGKNTCYAYDAILNSTQCKLSSLSFAMQNGKKIGNETFFFLLMQRNATGIQTSLSQFCWHYP